jgi:tetratricopeptide (TPR) repeat protein
MSAAVEHTESAASGEPIAAAEATVAGRYAVEAELARGGMGRVYRARDLSTGAQVALKRLRGGARANSALLGLFEREYRTLRGLKHPRIIDVYEYGVDRGGAYYTMELLAGTDLAKLAPQPYQQACAYLRDVASSLALLHARRLLHRDVSPHNVRVTEAGRCKLLDFGALTGFGIADQVVGTPPCIPPEAVRGAPLDQRADLYALGATAYYLLTRRHAYPAKTISDLSRVWQSGVPKPSQYAPGLPPALDALVLSLINHDPLARPESAGEVIERLNAIAGLPSDEEPQAAASYFWSTALVGREAHLDQIQGAVRAAVGGRGSALIVHGPSGVGRSRLLTEACLQAQLAGATVIQVDAGRERRENGAALALAAKLLDTAPEEALRAAGPYAPVLLHLLPGLEGKIEAARATIPEAPGEWRGRVQAALAGWLSAVCEACALVIAVDNLESADDASVALLATLAADANTRKLLVLTALRAERAAEAGSGVRFLRELAGAIELAPLTTGQTLMLARAMFGDVPHTMAIGEWMQRASGGLVSHCFELATELRRRDIVRYVGGTWVLPQDVSEDAMPSSIADTLRERIARLSPGAIELCEALSVHATPVGIELCNAVAGALGLRDLFSRVDELVDNDVLAWAGDQYRFRHDALRELLFERIEPARRRRLHLAMGNALLATTSAEDRMARVEAGWHLLRGGEELRGAQLLERTAMGFEIGTGSLQAAIPALEEARRVYLEHGRSLYELLPVVTRLAAEGYYSDRRLSTAYAGEAFALLRKATGLHVAERLRPVFGRKLGVYAGLGFAALRFYLTRPSRRTRRFTDVFVLLVNCVTTQAGAGTVCLDTEFVRRAVDFIEPLTALGPRHIVSAIHDYCTCLLNIVRERQSDVVTGCKSLLERFGDPNQFKALPDYVRQLYVGGALFALGVVESWRDGEDVLQRASELEALGLRIYDRAAHQLRMLYHAGRGDMDEAERCLRRMELHAVQTGSAWQVEVTVPLTLAIVYFALGDVVRIKRVSEQIEQLAARFDTPSLARIAHTARGSYLLLRGSAAEAAEIYADVLDKMPARTFVGWARAVGAQAQALNQQGRYSEALAACERAREHVNADDRRYVRMFLMLDIQHALALAGLGRTLDAAQRLQGLIAEHAPNQSPLTLGMLHEAHARVALLHRDRDTFARDLGEVERWFRPTNLPSLIARIEVLVRQGEEVFELRWHQSPTTTGSTNLVNTRAQLSQCVDERARAELALDLLLDEASVAQGHLFLVKGDQLVLTASRSETPPSRSLRREVGALLERFREDAGATRLETHGAVPTIVRRTNSDGEFRTHLLWCVAEGDPVLVGVVALRASPDERSVGFHFLQTVADGLYSPTFVSQ